MNLTHYYEEKGNLIIDECKDVVSEKAAALNIVVRGENKYAMQYINSIRKYFNSIGAKTNLLQFDDKEDVLSIAYIVNSLNEAYIYVRSNETSKELSALSAHLNNVFDIDALSYVNLDDRELGTFTPSVVLAALVVAETYFKEDFSGKTIMIVNRSEYVGKRLQRILTNEGATTILCNSKTNKEHLAKFIEISDCVIWGTGVKNIGNEYLKHYKENQLVVDLSQRDMTYTDDCTFDFTKIPGILTTAMLMLNYVSIANVINSKEMFLSEDSK